MHDTRTSCGDAPAEDEIRALERRVGAIHARMRLGIERDKELNPHREPINPFRPESFISHPALIERVLVLTGLYARGRRNAGKVRLTRNTVALPSLPQAFDGYTLLHLSDLHVDMSEAAMARVAEIMRPLSYDLCVITGDYRGPMRGPHAAAIDGTARVRAGITAPVYGVLGDHDTIRMVPALEAMGIRMLMNERVTIERGGARMHLAGIDDAHFYRTDDIGKAAADVPSGEFAILLSHTPEIYRQAAHAGFALLLSGHTHGGQVCLPGGIAMTFEAVLPRRMGAGVWRYRDMIGYTSVGAGSSVVPVRYNCPPEITVHELRRL
jgi:predicted MPP superfamily phosphohydrolase